MPLDLTNQDNPDLIKELLKEIPKDEAKWIDIVLENKMTVRSHKH